MSRETVRLHNYPDHLIHDTVCEELDGNPKRYKITIFYKNEREESAGEEQAYVFINNPLKHTYHKKMEDSHHLQPITDPDDIATLKGIVQNKLQQQEAMANLGVVAAKSGFDEDPTPAASLLKASVPAATPTPTSVSKKLTLILNEELTKEVVDFKGKIINDPLNAGRNLLLVLAKEAKLITPEECSKHIGLFSPGSDSFRSFQTLFAQKINPFLYDPNNKIKALLDSMTPEAFFQCIQNTRLPQNFAEQVLSSEESAHGYSEEVQKILARTSVVAESHIINDAKWGTPKPDGCWDKYNRMQAKQNWTDYSTPLICIQAVISAPCLKATNSFDYKALTKAAGNGSRVIDHAAYAQEIQRRLLPALLEMNAKSAALGKKMVIRLAGLGCGEFAGEFKGAVGAHLAVALRQILKHHANKLTSIKKIVLDVTDTQESSTLNVKIDASQKTTHSNTELEVYASHYKDAQLAPLSAADADCILGTVVAGDLLSWPGNDMWGDSRWTDEGVKIGSSDIMVTIACKLDPVKYKAADFIRDGNFVDDLDGSQNGYFKGCYRHKSLTWAKIGKDLMSRFSFTEALEIIKSPVEFVALPPAETVPLTKIPKTVEATEELPLPPLQAPPPQVAQAGVHAVDEELPLPSLQRAAPPPPPFAPPPPVLPLQFAELRKDGKLQKVDHTYVFENPARHKITRTFEDGVVEEIRVYSDPYTGGRRHFKYVVDGDNRVLLPIINKEDIAKLDSYVSMDPAKRDRTGDELRGASATSSGNIMNMAPRAGDPRLFTAPPPPLNINLVDFKAAIMTAHFKEMSIANLPWISFICNYTAGSKEPLTPPVGAVGEKMKEILDTQGKVKASFIDLLKASTAPKPPGDFSNSHN